MLRDVTVDVVYLVGIKVLEDVNVDVEVVLLEDARVSEIDVLVL